MDEHSRGLAEVRTAIVTLGQRIDRRFNSLDLRFDAAERRFDSIDRRFSSVDGRFSAVDGRLTVLERTLLSRFDVLDRKIGSLISIVVWALAAILTVVGSLVIALLLR